MRSSRRMCRTWFGLLAFVAFSSLTSLAEGSPLQVMSAPNLLRVGTAENIFVECQDCTGADIRVEIRVLNHPTKSNWLASTTVTLTNANHFQAFGQITVPSADFSRDPDMKQYVYLQAQFPDSLLEKVVLVSFQSGYIFIQTDKTLYTPNSRVHYRMFAVTPRMEPVERDDPMQNNVIAVEIENPEGNIFPIGLAILRSGIHSGEYQLSELVSPGLWKVVAKFQKNPQRTFFAGFEVKEHVLPSFEVKLTSETPFFYVDNQELTINIQARYLFGEEVDGNAFAVFGVVHEGERKSFRGSLQRVMIVRGTGQVTLRREHITQTFQNIFQLVGKQIYVAVSVLTENGGEMVEAELRGIKIIQSPYAIHFKKTPRYYKAGLSFDITIELLNPDDTPAKHVAMVLDPGNVQGITAANGIARLSINTLPIAEALTITVRTDDPRISSERQALATMVALPHKTKSNNDIHIGVDAVELKLGENLKINLNLRQDNAQNDITYLVLSRGQLVKHGRFHTRGQVLISLMLPITKEMLPSFRIIAYYHTNDNEVVSDSVWVDVKDSCMGSLKLELLSPAVSYVPRTTFGLKITGDPEATVGLVAVNKGVYALNNKHRLTQKKVWDIVENYDTGCTPGGGEDSMGVFYDAGLLFQSRASETPYRLDAGYMDSDEIINRRRFPESWLWTDVILPSCSHGELHCVTASLVKHFPLADSLTTWQFTGISLSKTHGICVADPLEVLVQKQFFIDLKLPYSAVRGEQLEIKAILHNYIPDPVIVRVDLIENQHLCSAASTRRKYRQEVTVGAQTTRSVPFIIIPQKEGRFPIEVKAAVKYSMLRDGLSKVLHVVPEGVLIKSYQTLTLDPVRKGVDGTQQVTINSHIPRKYMVPDTPSLTLISLTGRQNKSSQLENSISGDSMGSLIRPPSHFILQNIMSMSQTVIATIYLDKTNQWETVGFEKRDEALDFIKAGYRSFFWHRSARNPWFTANVVKVFAMANNLVAVQRSVICDAIEFLILRTQLPDGMFRDAHHVPGREIFSDSDASMTAFFLIAMQESSPICAGTVNHLRSKIDLGLTYLQQRLPSLTNPYAVAMASYALAKDNRLDKDILFSFAQGVLSHWPVSKGHIYTLEATAYALLALLEAKAFKEARPVFRWIAQQSRSGGSYGSAEATLMVYQAAAEYWTSANEQEYDLMVDLMLPSRSMSEKYLFNKDNYYTTRTTKMRDINQDVKVTATGTGEVTLTMMSLYYTLPQQRESDCKKLSVQLLPGNLSDDEKIYWLRIEVMYTDKDVNATMSNLDIGLPTGFVVNTQDLDLLSKTRSITVEKYELNRILTERGSLILHLNMVSHRRSEEITFRIHEKFKVGILQPAAVSVYEYLDQTSCVKFYHPERKNGQLPRHCTSGECTCLAADDCSMQTKENLDDDERTAKTGLDFVYKVRVEEITDGASTDTFTARIEKVIAAGSVDVDPLGKLRIFLSFPHCKESLGVINGNAYLIMGKSKDIQNHGTQSYQYELGQKTWIEYWPSVIECQMEKHRRTCLGIQKLVRQYEVFNCRQ
uniref:complement C3-like n=1 Tax=Semicossyphus pulcher TaxID=241346 RepID=UPI0037E923C7